MSFERWDLPRTLPLEPVCGAEPLVAQHRLVVPVRGVQGSIPGRGQTKAHARDTRQTILIV